MEPIPSAVLDTAKQDRFSIIKYNLCYRAQFYQIINQIY